MLMKSESTCFQPNATIVSPTNHFNRLLLTETLFPHLREVEKSAHEQLEAIMTDILATSPPSDKAANGIALSAHMAEVKRIAVKRMLDEVVYV